MERTIFRMHILTLGIVLPNSANENRGNLVKFELRINKYCVGQTLKTIHCVFVNLSQALCHTLKFYLFST